MNPDTVHTDKDLGKLIVQIVKEVNCHNCTNTCKNFGDSCKYGFPKYPLKETLVIDKNDISSEADESDKSQAKNYLKMLSDVEDVLRDDEKNSQNWKN